MTAVATHPPACTWAAPAPAACDWCSGAGVEPDEESAAVPCLACGGSGVPPCEFDLPPSRTHRRRSARFDPAAARLELTRGRKAEAYTVVEFPADPEYGRALAVEKKADGTVYHVRCGPAGTDCTCAGETYRSADRANTRAAGEGREVYPTLGCVHLDALVPLLQAGWLDAGRDRGGGPAVA